MSWWSAILGILSNLTGFLRKRQEDKNTAPMKEQAIRQQEQTAKDSISETTDEAMHGSSRQRREAALERARREDAE